MSPDDVLLPVHSTNLQILLHTIVQYKCLPGSITKDQFLDCVASGMHAVINDLQGFECTSMSLGGLLLHKVRMKWLPALLYATHDNMLVLVWGLLGYGDKYKDLLIHANCAETVLPVGCAGCHGADAGG
jgi:hypothetical protein